MWGLGLQFLLGVMILRWSAGYHFFRFLGDQVKVFLDYTDHGSKFVFGEEYLMHRMAFKVGDFFYKYQFPVNIVMWNLFEYCLYRSYSNIMFAPITHIFMSHSRCNWQAESLPRLTQKAFT